MKWQLQFSSDFEQIHSELFDSLHVLDATIQHTVVVFVQTCVFCCLSAGYRGLSGGMETSSHRAAIISWLPWRSARRHQKWPDWDPFATVGGEARRVHWHQEAPPAVWESQEGHVGELHSSQVVKLYCFCLICHLAILVMFVFFYLIPTL